MSHPVWFLKGRRVFTDACHHRRVSEDFGDRRDGATARATGPGGLPVITVDGGIGTVARSVYLCDRHLWAAGSELRDERFGEHLVLLGIRALVVEPAVVEQAGATRVDRVRGLLAEDGVKLYVADAPLTDADPDDAHDAAPQEPDEAEEPELARPGRELAATVDALEAGGEPPLLGLDVALSDLFLATQVCPEGAAQTRDVARTLATAAFLLPGPWILRGGDELGLRGRRRDLRPSPTDRLEDDLASTRSVTAHLRRVAAMRPIGAARVTRVDTGGAGGDALAYHVDPEGGDPYVVLANLATEVARVELKPEGHGRAAIKRIAAGAVAATLVTHEDTGIEQNTMRLGPWESRVYLL